MTLLRFAAGLLLCSTAAAQTVVCGGTPTSYVELAQWLNRQANSPTVITPPVGGCCGVYFASGSLVPSGSPISSSFPSGDILKLTAIQPAGSSVQAYILFGNIFSPTSAVQSLTFSIQLVAQLGSPNQNNVADLELLIEQGGIVYRATMGGITGVPTSQWTTYSYSDIYATEFAVATQISLPVPPFPTQPNFSMPFTYGFEIATAMGGANTEQFTYIYCSSPTIGLVPNASMPGNATSIDLVTDIDGAASVSEHVRPLNASSSVALTVRAIAGSTPLVNYGIVADIGLGCPPFSPQAAVPGLYVRPQSAIVFIGNNAPLALQFFGVPTFLIGISAHAVIQGFGVSSAATVEFTDAVDLVFP